MDRQDYKRAIFWFELASNLTMPQKNWGFVMPEYWGFIPNIELSVCHFKLGNIEEARKYNEKAGEYKPNSASVLQNRKYYEGLSQN